MAALPSIAPMAGRMRAAHSPATSKKSFGFFGCFFIFV